MAAGNLVTKVHQLRRQLNSEQELLAAQQEELRKVLERGAAQIGTTGRSWESASTRGAAEDGGPRDAGGDTQGSDAEHQPDLGLEIGAWEQASVEVRCVNVAAEAVPGSSDLEQDDIRRALREQREELAELRSRLAALEKSARPTTEIQTQPARPNPASAATRVAAKSPVPREQVEAQPRTVTSPVRIARPVGGYANGQPSERRLIPMPVQLRQPSPGAQSNLSPPRFAVMPRSRPESPPAPSGVDRRPMSFQMPSRPFEEYARRSLLPGGAVQNRSPAVTRDTSPRSTAGPVVMSLMPGHVPGPGWVLSPRARASHVLRPSSPNGAVSRGAAQIPAQK